MFKKLVVAAFIIPLFAWASYVRATGATLEKVHTARAIKGESAIEFKAEGQEPVAAFSGQLEVPEVWGDASSRKITVHYVRFPSTSSKPGAPIVYLSGGPGGSGIQTARRERFPLFMAMRQFGDVIAYDQRGTGEKNTLPVCESKQKEIDERVYTDSEYVALHKTAAKECLKFWRDQGVNISGYTTLQSARDLDALRAHLGAKKISLWGISYGTHLALAAVKVMDKRIDRLVLATVEGLDQTVKSPAQTDAYFERLQTAIDKHPQLKKDLPDVRGLIRRVHAKLDTTPITLQIPNKGGGSASYTFERREAQQFTSGAIADPANALRTMYLYAAIDQGIYAPLQSLIQPNEAISFRAMPLAMDIASGISRERLARMEQETKTALLGDYLNFPMPHFDGLVPELDLGDEFRKGPWSDIPTLVLMGSLDGRIYPDEQREAVKGLRKARIILIKNAGHNLFMTSPEITKRIETFMRGENVSTDDIEVELSVPKL